MNLYLAGTASRSYVVEENVKIYLAGRGSWEYVPKNQLLILESFYDIKEWQRPFIPQFKSFMLDSGAFTFMSNSKKGVNWDDWVARYARFIVDNKIELFFELDIDSIVGIKEVERLRDKLETSTNRKCIPVWHKSRGKEYWLQMAKNYDYIAIGGIVSGEITEKQYPYFTPMIEMAHDQCAKVHGLGFTQLTGLVKYKFDSVDSTAWTYGNRSGFLQVFNGRTLIKHKAPEGKRMRSKETAIHNFNEWVKFQQYAEEYL